MFREVNLVGSPAEIGFPAGLTIADRDAEVFESGVY